MTTIIIILCLVLIGIVIVQIGRVTELAGRIRGEEVTQLENNDRNALLGMIFLVVFLIGSAYSAYYYKNEMLGYGPLTAASVHGEAIDSMFNVTVILTGIVFVITQVCLFWFAYKYRGQKGRKAIFLAHDNKLEIIWTAIPAVVLTFLVVQGLDTWNAAMADVGTKEDVVEIEATGMQFAWILRYPGEDGVLGTRDYTRITGTNPLGQLWEDNKNLDDLQPSEIVLPVNKKVRVRITARDVLHNFYLPHFRVKMDAVPGIPTYFVFTPTITTEEFRQQLKEYPEYQVPNDPTEPDGPKRWEAFEYELACAELCGTGHFSMRRLVKIVSEEEYEEWLAQQQPYYMNSIRNTDDDPHKGKLLSIEIDQRKQNFNESFETAISSDKEQDKTLELENIAFQTGAAVLTENSKHELENLEEVMKKYPELTIEVRGHTDNTGTDEVNKELSEKRAQVVVNHLLKAGISATRVSAIGYGATKPIDTNETEEGKANNRRTEIKITNPIPEKETEVEEVIEEVIEEVQN